MNEKQSEVKEIPELNSRRTVYPSISAELIISSDYSNDELFSAADLDARTRYYLLLEKDPEIVPRQRVDLEKVIARGVFELYRRHQRID